MQQAQDAQALCRELGRRIVQAAYLALAVHLHRDEQARQQQKAGGAGREFSTDGELPLSAEGEAE